MINYAHRGASQYAPENTMCSFKMGYEMHANGVETDVQRTCDGKLVLFHDNDLMRICGRPEAVHDLTYKELLTLDMGAYKGDAFKGERIATPEEFLTFFEQKDVQLAIEIKEVGVEADTLSLIRAHHCWHRTIVTSAIWQALKNTHACAPDMRLGYLAKLLNKELLDAAEKCGIGQICPKASVLTPEWNKRLRERGFSVRAWGIDSVETMNRMIDMSVDGMTVNFPDVLKAELDRRNE